MQDLAVYLLLWWALRPRGGDVSITMPDVEWVFPVRSRSGAAVITQEFRDPGHVGVDIAVPGHHADADADVIAVAPGRVAVARAAPRGWEVMLDHGWWATSYHHMTELAVAVGDTVAAGDRLGTMGADPLDGEHVVHLHLQFSVRGLVMDPSPYLHPVRRG